MEDGIDRSAIREIKLLREIEDDNVVSVSIVSTIETYLIIIILVARCHWTSKEYSTCYGFYGH